MQLLQMAARNISSKRRSAKLQKHALQTNILATAVGIICSIALNKARRLVGRWGGGVRGNINLIKGGTNRNTERAPPAQFRGYGEALPHRGLGRSPRSNFHLFP